MTREDAIALLELMKREQRNEASIPPVESDAVARRYVKIMSQLDHRDRCGARREPQALPGRRSC